MPTVDAARRSRRRLDARLSSLPSRDEFSPPGGGWVRAVREALGMSQADLAARLRVAPQAVQQIEASERDGTVRLSTLRRAAEAMDCTVAYVLLPRTALEDTVVAQARRIAATEIAATERTMALEAQPAVIPPAVRDELVDRLVASKRLWRR